MHLGTFQSRLQPDWISVTNKTAASREFELVSLVRNVHTVEIADGQRLVAAGQPILRTFSAAVAVVSAENPALPGPLGGGPRLRHRLRLEGDASTSFDLQFLGDDLSPAEAHAAAGTLWQTKLASAVPTQLPDPKLQYAFDAALRQMLALIEPRPDHARVLKGLQHYYGANPYDTFQVSRALDAVSTERSRAATWIWRSGRCVGRCRDGIFDASASRGGGQENGNQLKLGLRGYLACIVQASL